MAGLKSIYRRIYTVFHLWNIIIISNISIVARKGKWVSCLRHYLVFCILLLIGGIEQNPGPGKKTDQNGKGAKSHLSLRSSLCWLCKGSYDLNGSPVSCSSDEESLELKPMLSSIQAHLNTEIVNIQRSLNELNIKVEDIVIAFEELKTENERMKNQIEDLLRKLGVLEAKLNCLEPSSGIDLKELDSLILKEKDEKAKFKDEKIVKKNHDMKRFDLVPINIGENTDNVNSETDAKLLEKTRQLREHENNQLFSVKVLRHHYMASNSIRDADLYSESKKLRKKRLSQGPETEPDQPLLPEKNFGEQFDANHTFRQDDLKTFEMSTTSLQGNGQFTIHSGPDKVLKVKDKKTTDNSKTCQIKKEKPNTDDKSVPYSVPMKKKLKSPSLREEITKTESMTTDNIAVLNKSGVNHKGKPEDVFWAEVHSDSSLFDKRTRKLNEIPKRSQSTLVYDSSNSRTSSKEPTIKANDKNEEILSNTLPASFSKKNRIMEMFPEEAGTLDPRKRIIPFLPGKKFFGRSHVREVAMKRMAPIAQYCKAILKLPQKISQSKEVVEFFDIEPDDINPPKERKKASIKANKISMPKALEHYIAVTEYKKQEKGEITLKVGMLVEVVEKTETDVKKIARKGQFQKGWWFVSVEDEQGWVPSTCLEREDGVKEETSIRFKPGEEEQYLCTEEFKPETEDEIGLERGAVVDVIEKNLEGWWIVRYNGKEGYVPATYLIKSEVFSMKKQKVVRTSVGGPEIVKSLHDISDLLKEEPKEEQEEKCYTIHEVSKILKEDKRGTAETDQVYECIESMKSRSLKRGGSVRPPPRPSVKPKREGPAPSSRKVPLVHADSFSKEFITVADFSDEVGDGISFRAGEVVKVLEKSDGGWWYIEIGDKEGWAPSTYIEESTTQTRLSFSEFKDDRISEEVEQDNFTSDSDTDSDDDDDGRRNTGGGGLANVLNIKLPNIVSKPLPPDPAKKKSLIEKEHATAKKPDANLETTAKKSWAESKNDDTKSGSSASLVAENKSRPLPAPPKKPSAGEKSADTGDAQSPFAVHLKPVQKDTSKQERKSKTDQMPKVPLKMGQPPPPPPKAPENKDPQPSSITKKPTLPTPPVKPSDTKTQVSIGNKFNRASDNLKSTDDQSGDGKPNVKGLAGALKAKFESDSVKPKSSSDTNIATTSSDVKKFKFGDSAVKPNPVLLKLVPAKAEPPKLTDKPKFNLSGTGESPKTNKAVSQTKENEVVSGGKVSDLASVLKAKLENRQSTGDNLPHSQGNETVHVGPSNVQARPVTVLKPTTGAKPPRPVTPPSPKTQSKPGHTSGIGKSPLSATENRDSGCSLNEDSVTKLNAVLGGKESKDLDPKKYSARPLPPKPNADVDSEDAQNSRKSSIPSVAVKPSLPGKPKVDSEPKTEFKPNAFRGDSAGVSGLASALKAKLGSANVNSASTDLKKPDIKPATQKPSVAIKPKAGEKTVLNNNSDATADLYTSIADFPGENEGEISLTIGVEVKLLEKAEGWWYVTYDSKEGWAPASYFEKVKSNTNTVTNKTVSNKPKSSQLKQTVFRTCSDFCGENEGELSFTCGEDVTVLEKPEGGWWYVQIGANEGWVPEAFLEEIIV